MTAKKLNLKKIAIEKTNSAVLNCLNQIYQAEMAGVMRYLHYSFMIHGHHRIPIQKWFRAQADESIEHAITIGEKLTALGGHPSIEPVGVEETGLHSVRDLLSESLIFERTSLELYTSLVKLAQDDIALEELARQFVLKETAHVEEVQKMLRMPE